METIKASIHPPWWNGPTHISIEVDKVAARKLHDEEPPTTNTLTVYMDGSRIEGEIGAAAHCPANGRTLRQHIGKASEYNMYTAEVHAVQLGAEIIEEAMITKAYTKCIIYADSQPAIRAIGKPKKQSGQEFLCATLDSLDALQDKHPMLRIELKWIPSHTGIEGNERADNAAKEAALARGAANGPRGPTPRRAPTLKSALKAKIHAACEEEWKTAWNEGNTGGHLRRITLRRHTDSGPKLYSSIKSRQHTAWLSRLRTGHCPLNKYRHRHQIVDDPTCQQCNNGNIETVEHYLLRCATYTEERHELRKAVGIRGMRMDRLLERRQLVAKTLEYVEKTGRFDF